MVFKSPAWVPQLPIDPPDSITIAEFMSNEEYGRCPLAESRNPYTCGISDKSYTAVEVANRTDRLARGIGKALGFHLDEGSEWDRVVCLFSQNTIDYVPFTHSIHRLNGIVTPASASYAVPELEHQLRSSGAKALFTCTPLLDTALEAARRAEIPHERIFILPMAGDEKNRKAPFRTIDDLIREGNGLPELAPLQWPRGQGARQVAYLCYSSGTSGMPKAVKISHRNVIANILQMTTYESVSRKHSGIKSQAMVGLLPFSHIYGLVPVAHMSTWRGDEIIVLPRFDLKQFLAAIERYKIDQISVVPPIIIQMLRNKELCSQYNLSSLRAVYTGAAPLGKETVGDLIKQYPNWRIGQGYGMTETATVVVSTSELDILHGSSGSLLPGITAKVIDFEGNEVTELEKPGELYVQGPAVTLGYLDNDKATTETFVWDDDGRWIRTGDEVIIRKSDAGNEHFVVVDRIKELIKVKGHQVAPAEIEAHLLSHPFVADCAVIQVPDDQAGEVPKAFVVKSVEVKDEPDAKVMAAIHKHVEEHKARHKWLKGGIEFIDVIPKSPSGKILRRMLRDKERQASKAMGPKL